MSVRLLQGDCREVLSTLDAGSVQCVMTSPPYFGLRDYQSPGQIGLETSPDAYVAELVAVFREVRRVLRDDGTLWLNLGDSYNSKQATHTATKSAARPAQPDGIKPKDLLGIPWMVAFALRADGWWLRSDIIWHKPNPMPESVTDRPTSAHEHVFLLTKAERYFYDADAVREPSSEPERIRSDRFGGSSFIERGQHSLGGLSTGHTTRNIRNVWTITTAPFADAHFATFPPELAERCIKAGTSERGRCPACGAPWARKVEIESRPNWNDGEGQKHDGTYYRPNIGGGVGNDARARIDRGWSQSCACPPHEPIQCTVLDPFAGAFTTALVADRLQRDAIGIELNADYVAMAEKRLRGDAPLFVDVAAQ